MKPAEMVAINRAMGDPDTLVISMEYIDKEGIRTRRVVSPIRWLNTKSFLALCLCRETPRRFETDRCSGIKTLKADDVLMPVQIETLSDSGDVENTTLTAT